MRTAAAGIAVVLAGLMAAAHASARTIEIGPDGGPTLAAAIGQAQPGDIIRLAPGAYYQCAAVRVRDLTLEGAGETTVLTDATCFGKAILVAEADNLTVRDLVLARARVPDRNGAGIRLEGQGLTLQHVVFDNDEVGVLAGAPGPGAIQVSDCRFQGGGVAGDRPATALAVGAVGRLVVERSVFTNVKGGQIGTAAAVTELVGNRIETGVEPGAGQAVLLSAGALRMQDNTLLLGPNPPPHDAAVLAVDGAAELRGNRLENRTGRPERLLLAWTHADPVLAGNTVAPGDVEWTSDGLARHRLGTAARSALADAHALAGATKQALKHLVGR